jgi:ABC-type uncharacterized transport system permease subunit
MKVKKAPSWTTIIISGILAGIVNGIFESQTLGLLVFMLLTSLGILIEGKLGYRK